MLDASRQLDLRTSPDMRAFGKCRFLTYNCLVIQFVAFSFCFATHFFPKLRQVKDYWFVTAAFPIGMLVVSSFWAVWLICGRENIFPKAIEQYYPPLLNHITHTIIAPINLAELVLVKHKYPSSELKAGIPLIIITTSYTSLLLYIRYKTGRFVYNFLNDWDALPVGIYLTGTAVLFYLMYRLGKCLHNYVHGTDDDELNKKSKN